MSGEGRDKQQCFQFAEGGSCSFEGQCRFWHGETKPGKEQERRGNRACYQFAEQGNCSFGDNCRFSHDGAEGGNSGGNSGGNNRRYESRGDESRGGNSYGNRRNDGGNSSGGQVCYSFRDKGDCQYGDNCKFTHEAQNN